MSPHLIIILMISSCSLLILVLFAVRKKAKKTASSFPTSQASSSPMMDHSTWKDLERQMGTISIPITEITDEQSSSDLIQLVKRYSFFQGKNFEKFSAFALEKNWKGIEKLIAGKFEAQGKTNHQELALEITGKLQRTLNPSRS